MQGPFLVRKGLVCFPNLMSALAVQLKTFSPCAERDFWKQLHGVHGVLEPQNSGGKGGFF